MNRLQAYSHGCWQASGPGSLLAGILFPYRVGPSLGQQTWQPASPRILIQERQRQSGQDRSIVFYRLISEVTSHHIVFVRRSKSVSAAHIQAEGITHRHESQEVEIITNVLDSPLKTLDQLTKAYFEGHWVTLLWHLF